MPDPRDPARRAGRPGRPAAGAREFREASYRQLAARYGHAAERVLDTAAERAASWPSRSSTGCPTCWPRRRSRPATSRRAASATCCCGAPASACWPPESCARPVTRRPRRVARAMAAELGWDEPRVSDEVDALPAEAPAEGLVGGRWMTLDSPLRAAGRPRGSGRRPGRAAARARDAGGDRLEQLAAAVRGVPGAGRRDPGESEPPTDRSDLASAVALELQRACARLRPSASARRWPCASCSALDHAEVAAVTEARAAAVRAPAGRGPGSRLRAELRGAAVEAGDCLERERTLRTVTLRQDGEPVAQRGRGLAARAPGHCDGCVRAHAAMLEGSSCYRAGAAVSAPARRLREPAGRRARARAAARG